MGHAQGDEGNPDDQVVGLRRLKVAPDLLSASDGPPR